jgi:hypothetical protein
MKGIVLDKIKRVKYLDSFERCIPGAMRTWVGDSTVYRLRAVRFAWSTYATFWRRSESVV